MDGGPPTTLKKKLIKRFRQSVFFQATFLSTVHRRSGGEAMEAAPSAKPRREPPPIPPNYVSLKHLQELRLKEKEEEEKRRREEEEEAAAAKRAAALKAEEAALAAAVKREAALKAETKGRAVSREASFCGVKERHRGGQRQWVAVGYLTPATTPRPTPTCGEVAAREKEWIVGGNRGKKGPDDVADNATHPHGGCKSPGKGKGKGKGKKKASSFYPGILAEEAAPAASNGGKPENKSEIKAMGKASVAPLDPAKSAVASSLGHLTCKGKKGAGGRSAETRPGDAPAKTAGPSPPRGVKSGNTGKPKPAAPRLADAAGTGSDSPVGKEAAPAQAPPTSKSGSGGPLRKIVEAKPEGLDEGQRRQPARFGRRSAEPWRGRCNGAAEPHVRVWVPKAAAAAAAAGSSAGNGDK